MARKPLPSVSVLWNRHEQLYTEVFILALQKLAQGVCNTSHEDTISEALCPMLTKVCYSEAKKRHCEIPTPDWEKAIQPVSISELKGGKIKKRPDFTCKWINPLASNAEEYEIPLHIECKRLGKSDNRNWILNENYVVNGIMRFDSNEHEYGKRSLSGLMIGYIISMTPNEILKEIESFYQKHCAKPFNMLHQFEDHVISQYRQSLKRCYVEPETFDIVHIWINLENVSTA